MLRPRQKPHVAFVPLCSVILLTANMNDNDELLENDNSAMNAKNTKKQKEKKIKERR